MSDTSELLKILLSQKPVEPRKPEPGDFKEKSGKYEIINQKLYKDALKRYNEVLTPDYTSKYQEWKQKVDPLMGQQTTSGQAEIDQGAGLRNYLKSGEHRGWEGGDIAALIAGGLLGRGIARFSGGGAPAGVARAVVPGLESLAAGGKTYQQYLSQPDQKDDPRGYDLHNLGMSTFGGLSGGAFTGGVENALAKPSAPQGGTTGPVTPPVTPGPAFASGQPHGTVMKDMADHFGIEAGTKKDTYPLVGRAVDNADEGTIRAFAARVPSIGPEAARSDSIATLRQAVRGVVDRVGTTATKFAGSVGPIALGAAGYGIADAAVGDAKASVFGHDDREANALANLVRGGGAGLGVSAGYGLNKAAGATGRGLDALADVIPENVLGRAASFGLRTLSRAAGPVGGALLLHDAVKATPEIPEDVRGRAWSNPDVQAAYFKGLRDEEAKKAEIASAFKENRDNYLAPKAGINPHTTWEQPVYSEGVDHPDNAPPGAQGMPRGAAYTQSSPQPMNQLAMVSAPNAPFNRALQEFIAHFAGQSGQR